MSDWVTLLKTETQRQKLKSPARFLLGACLLAASVLSVVAWDMYSSQQDRKKQDMQNAEIESLRKEIIYLDELLTMSAQMAVSTQDMVWQVRHQSHEAALERILEHACAIAPGKHSRAGAILARNTNDQLLVSEKKAMRLALDGFVDEAKNMLNSESYIQQKELYALGISSFYASQNLRSKLTCLSGAIKFLDEALTMSCKMAAATGDPEWEERYLKIVSLLDAAIDEASEAETIHGNDGNLCLALTNKANESLIAMETAAFNHVRKNELEKASEILNGEGYAARKEEYATGMRQFVLDLEKISQIELEEENAKDYYILFALLGVLLVTVCGWAFTLKVFKAWQAQEELATQELQEVNMSLDRRVGEQTKSLHEAVLIAQEGSHAKTEFLANMSHELRTPLTAILGFSENLLDPNQSKHDRANCVRTINRNGEYLLRIISDILDLSKIDAGKMNLNMTKCSPCQLLADLVSLMQVRIDAKGLELNIEFAGSLPCTITTDALRLRQLLVNIVGNAVKFTEIGVISIVTSFLPEEDSGQIQFEIRDSGCGLREDQVVSLFDPFVQADNSNTRNFGGTGLGLAVSKKFAELLGGEVFVSESLIGSGTTFCVRIQVGSLADIDFMANPQKEYKRILKRFESKPSEEKADNLDGYRLLLAEDGPDNQRLISFVMRKAGAEVDIVENGKLALEAALASEKEGNTYDAILMDMQMPVMGGYEATELLRKAGYHAPIIALTAHAMDGDEERCLNAGCNSYSTKPVKRAVVIGKIIECAAAYQESLEKGHLEVS